MYDYEIFQYRQRIFDEIIAYCESNSITSFYDLMNYVRENRFDWFKVIVSKGGTKYMVKYFKRINHYTGRF